MENKINVQRIAAKAVIVNEKNEVLIVREANTYQEGTNAGRYLLPGGRIEIGEHYFDGLKREVLEETGLEIAIKEPLFVSEWFPVIKGVKNQIIGIFFACKPLTSSITLSLEHDLYVWVEQTRLADYDMPDSDRQALSIWQSNTINRKQI